MQRHLALFLALVALVPAPALAQAPVQVFVEDLKVELKGWSTADAEALGKALAADLQGAIVKNPAYAPMTYENLESQLRKEKRAEQLSCSKSDQACIQKILDNYGCEERLYGTVRQVGGEAQVSLTRYRNQQLVANGAASDYAKPDAKAIRAVVTRLALGLLGATGGVASVPESPWNLKVEAVDLLDAPFAAEVVVDGRSVGKAPWRGQLAEGAHDLEVRDPAGHWQSFTRAVSLRTGSPTELRAVLSEPVRTALTITSEPAGAVAMVGLTPVGETPVTVQVPVGTWEVSVARDKHQPWSKPATLVAGRESKVHAILRAETAQSFAREMAGAPGWTTGDCRSAASSTCGTGIATAAHPMVAELFARDRALVDAAKALRVEMKQTVSGAEKQPTAVQEQSADMVIRVPPGAVWTSPRGTTFAVAAVPTTSQNVGLRAWGFGDAIAYGADEVQLAASAKVMALLLATQRARLATAGAKVKAMDKSYQATVANGSPDASGADEFSFTSIFKLTDAGAVEVSPPLRVRWLSKGYSSTSSSNGDASSDDEESYSLTVAVDWKVDGHPHTASLALEGSGKRAAKATATDRQESVALTVSEPPTRILAMLLEALTAAGYSSVRFLDAHTEKGVPVVTAEITTRVEASTPPAAEKDEKGK